MVGRPKSEAREMAMLMGDMTYVGTLHSKCGTLERYVKGGGCVHCARVIATEQRDARNFLILNRQTNAVLDIPQNAAKFAQSIEDDLM